MTRTSDAPGLRAGVMAASATAGMLVGVSRSAGDAWFALAAGGHLWLGHGDRPPLLFVALGAARHVLIFVAIGVLWGRLAARRPFNAQLLLAVVLAASAVGLSPLLPGLVRPIAIDLQPLEALLGVMVGAAGLLAGGRVFSP